MSDFSLITTSVELAGIADEIRAAGRFAIDTESASFHRYSDRVFLVQLSTDSTTWVVDPLLAEDMSVIGDLLADPSIEAILHDADFDLRTLHRDYGFTARRLFDTRVAADLAGEPGVGLAALLERYFDVRLDKRFQRADWSLRPLSPEMLAYAADDTRYLVALRDLLADRLTVLHRLAWAEEEFTRLEGIRWEPIDTAAAHLRLKGAGKLSPRQQAALRELHGWREDAAAALDRSPFRVASNEILVATAAALPETPQALRLVRGMPPGVARRRGPDLLAAVARALALPDAALPRRERTRRTPPDEATTARYDRLRELRGTRATAVGLAPGLVCPNATLMAIARAAGDGPVDYVAAGLKRWQQDVLEIGAIEQALAPASDRGSG